MLVLHLNLLSYLKNQIPTLNYFRDGFIIFYSLFDIFHYFNLYNFHNIVNVMFLYIQICYAGITHNVIGN